LHGFTWRLEGVEGLTLASFTGAAVGDWLRSPPFHAGGFEWRLSLAPNGLTGTEKGHVGVYCQLLTKDATAQAAASFLVGGGEQQSLVDGSVFSTSAVERLPRLQGRRKAPAHPRACSWSP
jgi:hypothetical protein